MACFVCLLAKQNKTFKRVDVINQFPILQGSAETLISLGEK